MSTSERIAQVAQEKWAAVSNLLRLLMINEQMSNSLKKNWLQLYFWYGFVCFKKTHKRFAYSLFFNDRFEQIAQVTNQK